ncbi:peptidoglycan recognition protein family protein [Salibacterium lacus]|uniref:Autolysin n=1 Tax=Salibacterium lacus TaxID=1898109 RepID=A0ABW5SXP3_9BACI
MATVQDLREQTPKRSGRRSVSAIKRIVRHHSASPGGDFFTFWKNTWSKFTPSWQTGGYHEVILRDGTVQVCYRPTMVTNGVGGNNSYTYHICLVGNGSFTDAQEKAWDERARYAMERFDLDISDIRGHNEMPDTATSCPGIDMEKVRRALRSGQSLGGDKSSSADLLTNGDQGDDVRKLQRDLMAAGEQLPRYGADGDYGSETEDAVKAFQARHGLTVDGKAGEKTLAKLADVLDSESETSGSTENVPHDSHEEAWTWAQEQGLLNGEKPQEPITREQMATVMKRYSGEDDENEA